MAVHQAIDISHQRNSGYRPSRVNIMAQGLSNPDPSLSPTHLNISRGRATTTHYTHHQVSLLVSRNTTQVSSLGLRNGSACEAGLSAGMHPKRKKKEKEQHTDVAKLVFALRRLTDITHSTYVLLLKAELVVIDSDAVSLDVKPQ